MFVTILAVLVAVDAVAAHSDSNIGLSEHTCSAKFIVLMMHWL